MELSIHNRAIGLNFMAVLLGVFGVLALCLSAIGVYGVMAYMVSEQTRDIGIRMALGAERQSVLAMVFRRGMLTIGAGLAVGLPLAFGFARLMASLIFGVSSNDPATFISIPLALLAAASLALYILPRRATKTDPVVPLPSEKYYHPLRRPSSVPHLASLAAHHTADTLFTNRAQHLPT